MSKPQANRTNISKKAFRPAFSVSQLTEEIASDPSYPGRVEVPVIGIDYTDAHAYTERKVRQQYATVALSGVLRRVAHTFIENYRLFGNDQTVWKDLGVGNAFEAAAIIMRAEFVVPAPTEAYAEALTTGVQLGDHAVYINLPK